MINVSWVSPEMIHLNYICFICLSSKQFALVVRREMSLGAYTGFHGLSYVARACENGDCSSNAAKNHELRSSLALSGHSYWICKACVYTQKMDSLATTISCSDKQRLATGLRLERATPGISVVPLAVAKCDAEVIATFKRLGGKVKHKKSSTV